MAISLSSFPIKESEKYTLQDLYKKYRNAKSQKNSALAHKASKSDHPQIESIKIKSPFYRRSFASKIGEKCPFHSYHHNEQQCCFHNISSKQKTKQRFKTDNLDQDLKISSKYVKLSKIIKTQQQEAGSNAEKNQLSRNIFKSQLKNSYDHIGHRVSCRNEQFQKFLSENELYILHETPIARRHKQKYQMNKQFCEKLLANFENSDDAYQLLLTFKEIFKKDNRQKKKTNEHKNKKKNYMLSKEQIKGLKMMIDVLKGQIKPINQKYIDKLLDYLQKSAEEFGACGNTVMYKQLQKMMESLMDIKNTIRKQKIIQQNRIKSIRNSEAKQRISSRKNIDKKSNSSYYQRSFKNVGKGGDSSTYISNIKKPNSKKEKKKLSIFNFQNEHKNQRRETIQENKQNHFNDKIISDEVTHKEESKQEKQKIGINKKQNLKRSTKKNNSRQKYPSNFFKDEIIKTDEQALKNTIYVDSDQLVETMELAGIRYSRFCFLEKEKKEMRQFRSKQRKQIEQHLLKKAEEQERQALLLKKKYIEKNRMFLKKVQKMMKDLDLGVFVINQSDSLITQKKKIRYLKQLLLKAKSSSEFNTGKNFQQLARYIQLYSQHCNLILGKQLKNKNDEQFNEQKLQEEARLQDLLTNKDITNSMKFIHLEHNQINEREQKVDGWISIPQFTTFYHNQDRKIKIEKSKTSQLKKIENHSACESEQSNGSLAQCQLMEKAQFEICDEDNKQQQRKENTQIVTNKKNSFQIKLQKFRQKLLFNH